MIITVLKMDKDIYFSLYEKYDNNLSLKFYEKFKRGEKMIRDYKTSDLDDIIKIYTAEYKAMPEEIETLKSAPKILVYDDNGIQGFVHMIISGTYCYMEMGAASDEQILPVGLKLWEEVKKLFTDRSVNFIQVFHVKDNLKWQQLFNMIGFDYWYSIYRLSYQGSKFDETDIQVMKYEDKYYEDKIRLESEAFSVLREQHDIKPYNWYLNASKEALENNRESTLNNKDFTYLFFEGSDMIGASMVKGAEIELLFTNIKYQKKGCGKKILQYTVNRGLEQDSTVVSLNVLASNEKALNLYKDTGFEFVQAQDCRRLAVK
jgi:ribosomal protein S18 acetylase RimI-like enzyme